MTKIRVDTDNGELVITTVGDISVDDAIKAHGYNPATDNYTIEE